MKNKEATIYTCRECGYQSSKWLGKCPDCSQWASFDEEIVPAKNANKTAIKKELLSSKTSPAKLSEVTSITNHRISTGISELNRVLGGGVVPGSVTLLGGDPGIGKSTILIQASKYLADRGRVLYVSGEESAEQIKMRASRMGITSDNIYLVCETDISVIEEFVKQTKADFIIADSIQTLNDPEITSASGTVSQVRSSCAILTQIAKSQNIPVFIVGHVTKEGMLAGPKVLEHMVDTVLYFEGDRQYNYRILRCVKNRFGSTDEIGIFEMSETGLEEVGNPSAVFLEERSTASGSCVVPILEGTRPILVEVQALAATSHLPNPRRMASGIDVNRVMMIIAVLEKRVNISLGNKDVWVNVAGGVKISETAADLAIAAAIASSLSDVSIDKSLIVMGEIGLSGEIRRVIQSEKRINEAQRLGFTKAVIPNQQTNNKGLFKVAKVTSLSDAINKILCV